METWISVMDFPTEFAYEDKYDKSIIAIEYTAWEIEHIVIHG